MHDTRQLGGRSRFGIANWDDIRLVIEIANAGSFQKAAVAVGANQTTISRRFQRLEGQLGTKLFERHGNNLIITKAGQAIVDRALQMRGLVDEINSRFASLDELPTGIVKIAVTEGLGNLWLTRQLGTFLNLYPDISVEIIPTHGEYDLLAKEVDIAIGWGRPNNDRHVAKSVGSVSFYLYASREYIAARGMISTIDQIKNHDFVQYGVHDYLNFAPHIMSDVKRLDRIKLFTSSASIFVSAIRSGLGVGVLPQFYNEVFDDIVPMPLSIEERGDLWISSHEETRGSRRIRVMLDHLNQAFGNERQAWFSVP